MLFWFLKSTTLLTVSNSIENPKGINLSSSVSSIGQFLYLLIIFLCIVFLAYFSTKLLGTAKTGRSKNANMQMIESVSVGFQNSVQIIRVGDKYFLIGVSKDKISFLSEIDKESIIERDINDTKIIGFNSILEQQLAKQIGKVIHKKSNVTKNNNDTNGTE